jgi:predicted TIM-barrel fold metal-dependent hydrolase
MSTAAARTVPEQCLFGSNTPNGDVLASRATIEAAVPDPAVRERLFTTNAATIFGHLGIT